MIHTMFNYSSRIGVVGVVFLSLLLLVGCNHEEPPESVDPVEQKMENAGYLDTVINAKDKAQNTVDDAVEKKEKEINSLLNDDNSMENENNSNNASEGTTQGVSTVSFDESKFKALAKEYSGAVIKTSKGDVTVDFYGADSPVTVGNFIALSQAGVYDGTLFHRVIKNFMIQGGDPLSKDRNPANDGTGGPGYKFSDEFNSKKLVRGSLAMANSGANTNGSQFFIVTTEATPWLDGKHTNFGKVTAGMDVVDAIEATQTEPGDRPVSPISIESIELVK